jgi:hypothetical protein
MKPPLALLVTPAVSVCVAVSVCDPEARCTDSVHVPFEATVAVPTAVEPS